MIYNVALMSRLSSQELIVAVGDPAPHFTLPAIQGGQVSLADYHGHSRVILWFSRGFTCNFCRRYMQLILSHYAEMVAHEIEVVQVAPNLLETSRLFFDPATPVRAGRGDNRASAETETGFCNGRFHYP